MTVAAVIVTFNRLELLQVCIDAVKNQSRKLDTIIVINNGSTDGTEKWLSEQPDIFVVNQENLGGAGGFHTGIKSAFEQGYDWIWCMDDDGRPTQNCLENMTRSEYFQSDICLNSLVVDDKFQKLSFYIPVLRSYNRFFDYYFELTDDIETLNKDGNNGHYEWGMFFNSVLLPRRIVEVVGLPRKEFFIWGDEVEYFYRIREKFKIFIVLSSRFHHPKNLNKSGFIDNFKYRHYIKNYIYINMRYLKWGILRNMLILMRVIKSMELNLIWQFILGLKNYRKLKNKNTFQ